MRKMKPANLRDETSQTEAGLAYDNQYLYLAVRCEKSPTNNYDADTRLRTYDANLSEQDHVQVGIDVDRDYATSYRLSLDHRGWTADACWQNSHWNPRWFVAAGGDDSHWVVEAAIPWLQLTEAAPQSGHAWAWAIRRRDPTRESHPSASSSDEFSLLLFE